MLNNFYTHKVEKHIDPIFLEIEKSVYSKLEEISKDDPVSNNIPIVKSGTKFVSFEDAIKELVDLNKQKNI